MNRTIIKMSNGNSYVVERPMEDVMEDLQIVEGEFALIDGTEGRKDFYINITQIVAVFPE